MSPVLASLLFSNPALWIGGLALTIPIAIHLLTRRTPKRIVFPTLEFLRKAMARQSHFYRLRHLLLLFARTLLLLLLLLVFVKPVWLRSGIASSPGQEVSRTQIILLDASASMGYTAAGVTPGTQAVAAARKILAAHRPLDRVNLIRIGATPRSCYDEPSDNVFFIRKDLQDFVPTQEHADINAALAEALRQLEGVAEGRKQIFFISDFQRSNWSAVDFGHVSKDIELFFIETTTDHRANTAITEVTVRPSCPTVAEPVQIQCKVANYSDQIQKVPLVLHIRDGATLEQEVILDPHTSVAPTFEVRFNQPGSYESDVSLPQDGLHLDDRRYVAVTVAEKVNILLVSDNQHQRGSRGGHFLERAINPYLQQQQATAVATVVRSTGLTSFNVSRAQVVVLSEINELSPSALEVLLTYLRDGGSVVYFHVGGADAHNLSRLAAVSEGDFVCPYTVSNQVAWQAEQDQGRLADANFDHAILKKFKESTELADIGFYQYFQTKRVELKGQILMRYEDRNIAMAQSTVGAGMVLLCNFGCGLDHSDVAKHTLFVPLVHEIIKYLRPSIGNRNAFTVGQQCYTTITSISPDNQIVFEGPDQKTLQGSMDIGSKGAAVFFPKADSCGFYRVKVDNETAGSIGVNLNPLESNLERLDTEQIKTRAEDSHRGVSAIAAGRVGIEQAMSGKSLWPYFLIATLCLFCLEQVLTVMCKP